MPNPFNPGASKDVSIARFFESRPGEAPWSEKASQYLWEKYGQPAIGALALPGDVYAGRVDPKSEEGIGRAFDLAGMMTLGAGAMPSEGTVNMGIKAFHGSPHDFDKFDLSKVGTGEGAQAYGHGLYFAENEAVAQGYKDALRRMGDEVTFDGKPVKTVADYNAIQKELEDTDWRQWKAVDDITKRQGDFPSRLKEARDWYRGNPEMLAAIDRVEQRMGVNANPGHMYEVNIAADPKQMLDWDAPLGKQPERVRKFFNDPGEPKRPADPLISSMVRQAERQADGDVSQIGMIVDNDPKLFAMAKSHAKRNAPGIYQHIESGMASPGDYVEHMAKDYISASNERLKTGGDLYREHAQKKMQEAGFTGLSGEAIGERELVKALQEAGIPGNRYFDAGSRAAGDGSRNYVVFDDKLISIARKYGWVPGMAIPAAMMLELQGGQGDKPKGPEA